MIGQIWRWLGFRRKYVSFKQLLDCLQSLMWTLSRVFFSE
uniref:Uncharacterized protein n=1 Tax=Arundo donax TaxID=35708 RepID=A0A0A8YCY3_ARUDO